MLFSPLQRDFSVMKFSFLFICRIKYTLNFPYFMHLINNTENFNVKIEFLFCYFTWNIKVVLILNPEWMRRRTGWKFSVISLADLCENWGHSMPFPTMGPEPVIGRRRRPSEHFSIHILTFLTQFRVNKSTESARNECRSSASSSWQWIVSINFIFIGPNESGEDLGTWKMRAYQTFFVYFLWPFLFCCCLWACRRSESFQHSCRAIMSHPSNERQKKHKFRDLQLHTNSFTVAHRMGSRWPHQSPLNISHLALMANGRYYDSEKNVKWWQMMRN